MILLKNKTKSSTNLSWFGYEHPWVPLTTVKGVCVDVQMVKAALIPLNDQWPRSGSQAGHRPGWQGDREEKDNMLSTACCLGRIDMIIIKPC